MGKKGRYRQRSDGKGKERKGGVKILEVGI